MKFFTASYSKYLIAALCIVTIGKPEMAILHYHFMFLHKEKLLIFVCLWRLSLKPGFGGYGHSFGGCDGLGGLGGFEKLNGFGGFDGFSGFGGFDGFSGFSGFSGFDGFDRFGRFDGFGGFTGFDG